MKKLLYIVGGVIVLILIIAIAGGGENKEVSNSTPEKVTTVYSINQDVRVCEVRWKLIDVKDHGNILKGSESQYPEWHEDITTSGKFIEITLEAENLGKGRRLLNVPVIIDN